jgi:hypothetical protein
VRVDDDALVDAEGVAEDHVGRLATDAWQRDELGHRAGNLAAVLLDEGLGHAPQGARLVAVEAGRPDVLLELAGVSLGVVRGGAVLVEEGLRDAVYPDVGGLGERIVATRSSSGFVQSSSVWASGYSAFRRGITSEVGAAGPLTMAGDYTLDYTSPVREIATEGARAWPKSPSTTRTSLR